MGRSASFFGLCSERRSHSPHRQKTRCGHQRKSRLFQTLYSLSQPCWRARENGSPPIQLCAISTNPASLKAEGKEPQIQSGLWKSNTSKKRHQTQWTDFVVFARWAQTWLRSRRAAYRACRHRASAAWEMIFDRLANLFQILKPHRGAFTRCILHGRVPCQSVHHLTIRAIPQKLYYLGKQCFGFLSSLRPFSVTLFTKNVKIFCGT